MRQDDPVLSAWKTFTLTMTMTLTILRLLFGMSGPEVSHSCNVLYLSGCIFVFPWVHYKLVASLGGEMKREEELIRKRRIFSTEKAVV